MHACTQEAQQVAAMTACVSKRVFIPNDATSCCQVHNIVHEFQLILFCFLTAIVTLSFRELKHWGLGVTLREDSQLSAPPTHVGRAISLL